MRSICANVVGLRLCRKIWAFFVARSKKDIYKKFDKDSVFIIGETIEDRARILYIRGALKPSQIIRRLVAWGDEEIPAETLRTWIKRGGWKKLRDTFKETYDVKVAQKRAEKVAEKDVSNEDQVREVYANLSGQVMNIIGQKLKFNMTPDADAPVMGVKDINMLSETLKNMQDIHFRALGIPELAVVDPTQGQEGIRILTKRDLEKLDNKSDE